MDLNNTVLYPWEYTDIEGGIFKPWLNGSVDYSRLKKLVRTGDKDNTVFINFAKVHSLIFESSSVGHSNYARWDCVNGWTTTLSKAKENFPNGLHGKVDGILRNINL